MMMSEAFKMSYDVIAKSDKCKPLGERGGGGRWGVTGANDREPVFKYTLKNCFY